MNEFPGSEDERIRQLLDDAVSHVEPRESLDAIRSRTTVTPLRARRGWFLGAGAAVVATAATVAAVAVLANDPGTTNAQDPGFAGPSGASSSAGVVPSPDPKSTPSTDTPPTGEQVTVPVYYVGDTSRGPRLYREFHQVQRRGEDAVTPALNEAVGTPALDDDYRTDWPAGTTVDDISFDGVGDDGLLTINVGNPRTNLHDRPSGLTEQEASLAIEQLIYTAQGALQARAPVQFMLNGERTDTLLGVPTSEPLAQGDPTTVQALVWIIDPAEGAEVRSTFKVSGLANAFEANVQWELMRGDTTVDSGFTTAEEAFTLAPYSFTVKNVPPGEYTLVVHDSDPSGGEGFAPWQDTKDITVVE